jgi:hypothetical protein
MANAQYHRRSMLPRRVHNGLRIGGLMPGGFSMEGTVAATLMSTLEKPPFAFIPLCSQELCHRPRCPQSQAAATDSAPQ